MKKKKTNPSNKNLSNNKTNESSKFLEQWIEVNAEKITKEIIKREVKNFNNFLKYKKFYIIKYLFQKLICS